MSCIGVGLHFFVSDACNDQKSTLRSSSFTYHGETQELTVGSLIVIFKTRGTAATDSLERFSRHISQVTPLILDI